MRHLALLASLLFTACGGDDGDDPGDGTMVDDGGVADAATPVDQGPADPCAPVGVGEERSCPTGCTAITAKPIDAANACYEDRDVVALCHAADAEVIGNTAAGCMESVADPSFQVWTPTTGISVGGGRNLFDVQGWQPCADAELWTVEGC